MADVVICSAEADRAAVETLAAALRGEGHDLFLTEAATAEEIGAAGAVIVVWSANAAASRDVRATAGIAYEEDRLIQVSVDGRMPPLPFSQLHFVSIEDWRGEADHPAWTKVRESVAARCGPGAEDRSL